MKHWNHQLKHRRREAMELLSVQEIEHEGLSFILENWRIVEEAVEEW